MLSKTNIAIPKQDAAKLLCNFFVNLHFLH